MEHPRYSIIIIFRGLSFDTPKGINDKIVVDHLSISPGLKVIKTTGANTSGLLSHLRYDHKKFAPIFLPNKNSKKLTGTPILSKN